MSKSICIVATNGTSLTNFRGPFISDLVKRGYEVTCVSIEPPEEMEDSIRALGAKYVQVEGSRVGTGIFSGFGMIKAYKRLFRELNPDVCFLYMSKPIAFGGYAAVKSKVKHINILVNGLENAYYRTGFKDFIVRCVMSTAYRYVSNRVDNVFFQNHDDMKYFKNHRILKKDNALVVGGSGVDMSYFQKKTLPDKPIFLMVARLLWSKGIREYLAAAEKLKNCRTHAKVMLVGGMDKNDESLSEAELNDYIKKADIEYCGFANDVRPYLEKCSVFVLPSYHEGLPRSVIEAMSVGRAIITTDVPGCRETVNDGKNGYLVPVRDCNQLFQKMKSLADSPELRLEMAEQSYRMCKAKFEVGIVNQSMIEKMEEKYSEQLI